MTDIAPHVRIFEANPTDELVQKRQAAALSLAEIFKKRSSFAELLGLANEIASVFTAKGKLSDPLATQVEAAIKDDSPSFVREDHELEIEVCAALGVLNWLDSVSPSAGAASRADVVALGVWSALSFQKPLSEAKRERLRLELLKSARTLATRSSENSRQRVNVPEATLAVPEAEGWPGLEKRWKDGPLKAINALRLNAALDREEIDVLWWAIGDWSNSLAKRLSSLNAQTVALVGAIEVARLLKRMPAESHRHVILRHIGAPGNKQDLAGFVKELGDDREAAGALHASNSILEACPHVFPLLTGVALPDSKASGHKETRPLHEWAIRALMEASMLHLSTLPALIS